GTWHGCLCRLIAEEFVLRAAEISVKLISLDGTCSCLTASLSIQQHSSTAHSIFPEALRKPDTGLAGAASAFADAPPLKRRQKIDELLPSQNTIIPLPLTPPSYSREHNFCV